MQLIEKLKGIRTTSREIALLKNDQRNDVLRTLMGKLNASHDEILAANAKDLAQMDKTNPMYDRLLLTKSRLTTMNNEIETIVALEAPLNKILESKIRPNGLVIKKVSVPFGVIAIIYESRPNVTVDTFTLCFKAGNACVLKGGKEAYHSNSILVQIIQEALLEHEISPNAVHLCSHGREDTEALIQATNLIDVCIPRGSQSLINFVRNNAKVPFIETGAGIVHAYFDLYGDIEKGSKIINNSKTRRVSVCNALDCLLIHKERLSDLYALIRPLEGNNVEIFADSSAFEYLSPQYPKRLLFHASPQDFGQEFISYKLAIKAVDSLEEALNHITHYTSGHSEAIITENTAAAEQFTKQIDAAVVYVNASTAFTDGAQFGLGSEIGISTQKLHARGPMGLEALTTYKWICYGNGQIRT